MSTERTKDNYFIFKVLYNMLDALNLPGYPCPSRAPGDSILFQSAASMSTRHAICGKELLVNYETIWFFYESIPFLVRLIIYPVRSLFPACR